MRARRRRNTKWRTAFRTWTTPARAVTARSTCAYRLTNADLIGKTVAQFREHFAQSQVENVERGKHLLGADRRWCCNMAT